VRRPMACAARKSLGSLSRREESFSPGKRPNERRRKDEKKERRRVEVDDGPPSPCGAGPGTPNGLPPSPARSGPACAGQSKQRGIPSERSLSSEDRPGILDDVDMSEVKVQEDQLLAEAGEFVCKICQIYVVGRSPKLTQCSHLFCGDCLAEWFSSCRRAQAPKQARVAPCPVCKTSLDEFKHVSAVSSSGQAVLWRMLASLKIMCANHGKVRPEGKCEWTGCYSEYQKHIATCGHAAPALSPPPTSPPPPVAAALALPPELPPPLAIAHSRSAPPATGLPAPPSHCIEALPTSGGVSPMLATAPNSLVQPLSTNAAASGTWQAPLLTGAAWDTPGVAASTAPPAHFASATPANRLQAQGPSLLGTGPPQQDVTGSAAMPMSACSGGGCGGASSQSVCRALGSFDPAGPDMVQVRVGDLMQIVSNLPSGWTYCHNLTTSGTGWAPSWIAQAASAEEEAVPPDMTPAPLFSAGFGAMEPPPQMQPPVWQRNCEQQLPPINEQWQGQPLQQPAWQMPQAPQRPPQHQPWHQPPPHTSLDALQSQQGPPPHQPWQQCLAGDFATSPPAAPPGLPSYAGIVPNASPVPAAMGTSPNEAVRGQQQCYEVKDIKATFAGVGPSQLSLAPGELVEIVERDASGWTYGRKVTRASGPNAPPVEGWFPEWACASGGPRPPVGMHWGQRS
jgi:hypothetical protein